MPAPGFEASDADAFRLAAEAAEAAVNYRTTLHSTPIRPSREYAGMLAEFAEPLPEAGLGADRVVTMLDRKGRDGLANSCSPRFFGYVIGGGLPAALAADMLVARNCRLARRMAAALASEPGIEILNEVNLNQVVVAFGERGRKGDRLTDKVLKAVQAEGTCYPSHGNWHGRRIMRLSVCGFATTEGDADRTVAVIRETWHGLRQPLNEHDGTPRARKRTRKGSPAGP